MFLSMFLLLILRLEKMCIPIPLILIDIKSHRHICFKFCKSTVGIKSHLKAHEQELVIMKAFMDDVTLIAESRSHMEQLVTRLQELFKSAAMKIMPSKCRSLSLLKGNCKEIKFSVSENEIPAIREKSVKSLGRCYSLPLTDRHRWQDLRKQLQNGLRSIDKCDLMNKDKIWCIYFELIPKLAWPLQIYEVSLTKVETMERLISKSIKNGWEYLTP